MTKKLGILVLAIGAVAALLAIAAVSWRGRPASVTPDLGGPFALIDANNGETVTERSFEGKLMVIYFGYTFCPDACPTTLNNVSQALAKLGADADRIAPLFISVDPERDTPQVMARYVKAFDPRIRGLTGDAETTLRVAKEFGVYYRKHDVPGGYLIDHSSLLYIMDGKGALLRVLPASESGDRLAGDLRRLLGSKS